MIKESELKPEVFEELLHKFLQTTAAKIRTETRVVPSHTRDLKELEEHLLEINQFYYQSFHQSFFPQYSRELKQSLAELLRIRTQEDVIKKDLMALIRRYARLFNQHKTQIRHVAELRDETHLQLRDLESRNIKTKHQITIMLEQLQYRLGAYHREISTLCEMGQDETFLQQLAKYPGHLAAVTAINNLEAGELKHTDQLQQLLVQLKFNASLLEKLLQEDLYSPGCARTLAQIETNNVSLLKPGTHQVLDQFWRNYYMPYVSISLAIITPSAESKKAETGLKLLRELVAWVQGLIIIIEKCVYYLMKNVNAVGHGLYYMKSGEIDLTIASRERIEDIQKTIGDPLTQMQEAKKSDARYFFEAGANAFGSCVKQLNDLRAHIQQGGSPLGLKEKIYSLYLEGSLAATKFEALELEVTGTLALSQSYSTLAGYIDAYLQGLGEVNSDLERILAPRNISRFFKDLTIRVERVPLQQDQLFPSAYAYLLKRPDIQQQASEKTDKTILHEEGDLFIIGIDELQEYEVPYIIVSTRSNL